MKTLKIKINNLFCILYNLILKQMDFIHSRIYLICDYFIKKEYYFVSVFISFSLNISLVLPFYFLIDKIILIINIILFLLNFNLKILLEYIKILISYIIILILLVNYKYIAILLLLKNIISWILKENVSFNNIFLIVKYINYNLLNIKKGFEKKIYDFINSDLLDREFNYDIVVIDLIYNINNEEDALKYLIKLCKEEMYYNSEKNYKLENIDNNINIYISNNIIYISNKHINFDYYYLILEVKKNIIYLNNIKYNIISIYYIGKKNIVMQYYKDKMCYDTTVRIMFFTESNHINLNDLNILESVSIDNNKWNNIMKSNINFKENV